MDNTGIILLFSAINSLIIFGVIYHAHYSAKQRHIALMTYFGAFARSLENNEELPQPTLQALDPSKKIEKSNSWTPSQDSDYVMKGNLVDPYD